ncbi:nucleolar protein 7 isoform X2 [Rissa tridactyla]|uniref:nucleolar protein 7 isoform X2 n=1 Tax=Rissa tridactyla TaxID=75485 RepID=UPI0023BAF42B|nr:nucleolar protein 7 isoform X2 [Rissa tridactyla]
MAPGKKAAAAKGKRGLPAALLSPPSSEDEAPEEVSFGAAREVAETERKLMGEAARRHRELLKEKRRRRQELFVEQKRRKLLPEAVLQELAAAPPARPEGQDAADDPGEQCGGGAAKQRQGQVEEQDQAQRQVKKAKQRKVVRYAGRANEFFSLENKRDPVKKAAVQFVDKSWGQEKKLRAIRFKKRWLSTQLKKQV